MLKKNILFFIIFIISNLFTNVYSCTLEFNDFVLTKSLENKNFSEKLWNDFSFSLKNILSIITDNKSNISIFNTLEISQEELIEHINKSKVENFNYISNQKIFDFFKKNSYKENFINNPIILEEIFKTLNIEYIFIIKTEKSKNINNSYKDNLNEGVYKNEIIENLSYLVKVLNTKTGMISIIDRFQSEYAYTEILFKTDNLFEKLESIETYINNNSLNNIFSKHPDEGTNGLKYIK